MKNFIGIDPSEDSTAVSIKSNKGYFLFNYTILKESYKWIKMTKDYINFKFYNYEKFEEYSKNEISTLKTFIKISSDIINDIIQHIDINEETFIGMEGYNYSMFSGNSIIDLVGISTCIRKNLLDSNINLKQIEIIAPKSLKSKTCEMVYGVPEAKIGKNGKPLKEKVIAKNNDGIKGGDFTKKEMLVAIYDGNIISPLTEFYNNNKMELLSYKTIQKPFEDVNDSILLLSYIENIINNK